MLMYILCYINWDDTAILGVFDSEQKAKAALVRSGYVKKLLHIQVLTLNEDCNDPIH